VKGQTSHPDTDVLAEFHAGLITGRRGARISGHLAGCERCTALGRQLADVSTLLAAVPAPAMPQSVADRLDTVLVSEAAKRNYPERPRDDSLQESGSRHRRPGNRGFRLIALRVLAPVAVVLLAAGGYGLSRLASGPSGHGSAESSAGRAPVRAGPAQGAASGAASGAARGAGTGVVPGAEPRAKPQYMSPHRFTVTISNTDYRRATLRQQLEAELGASTSSRPARTPSGQLMSCVQRVTGDVLAVHVESARFEGRPATVIVVPKGSGEMAWVVGAGCSGTNRDLLDSTTLPPGI
jgi:DNA-binding FrmR family transcriptional regulator